MSSGVAFLRIYGGRGTVPKFSQRSRRSIFELTIASPSPRISSTLISAFSELFWSRSFNEESFTKSLSPDLIFPRYITLCLCQSLSKLCRSKTTNSRLAPLSFVVKSRALITFVSFKMSKSPLSKKSAIFL